jgi:hypothetical protein
MALIFPNYSRFYDATRRAVQFWGYDSAMEASFFVTEDALQRMFSPSGMVEAFRPFPTRGGAAAFLQAFLQEGAGEYGFSDRSG